MTTLALLLALWPASETIAAEPDPLEGLYLPVVLASGSSTTAARRDFSYTFVELSYSVSNIDGTSEDATGFGLQGSYGFHPSFFVFASLSRSELGVPGFGDLETDAIQVGGGYHRPLGERVDLVLDASLISADAELAGFSASDDGYALEAGVRAWAGETLEVGASVQHVDVASSETGITAVGRWYFSSPWSIGVGLSHFDDADTYGVGLRYSR